MNRKFILLKTYPTIFVHYVYFLLGIVLRYIFRGVHITSERIFIHLFSHSADVYLPLVMY